MGTSRVAGLSLEERGRKAFERIRNNRRSHSRKRTAGANLLLPRRASESEPVKPQPNNKQTRRSAGAEQTVKPSDSITAFHAVKSSTWQVPCPPLDRPVILLVLPLLSPSLCSDFLFFFSRLRPSALIIALSFSFLPLSRVALSIVLSQELNNLVGDPVSSPLD